MENQDDGFSKIRHLFKSLIPGWGFKSTNVSRDFWMPDESCRVCYTCDVEFGFFNRKHHCRLCGRIFCATCTTHRVPMDVSFDDKKYRDHGDMIRVCNFCFKQWNEDQNLMRTHETASEGENDFQPSIHSLSSSQSTTSLLSTKSTFSANVSNATGSSRQSTLPNQLFSSHESAHSPDQSISIESDRHEFSYLTKNMDFTSDIHNYSSNRFEHHITRYDTHHPVTAGKYYHQSSDYHGQDDYDKVGDDECLHVVHSQEASIDAKLPTSTIHEGTEFQSSIKSENIEKVELDNLSDCNLSSHTCTVDKMDSEMIDFENNGMLWLPPSPLNAVDEEVISINDEEEENAAGEFSYKSSFKNFGRDETQNKIQSVEEHKVSMKNSVVSHFRALVTQLLFVEDLAFCKENDKENWLEIITSLSWEVATLLKPNTSKEGGMDPGGYTKIKCLSCGRRSDSFVVKGVVLRKNLAHRRMKSRIEKPRLLLLGGDLEYQRVSNHLSSFDTLLQQEMDHLKMAVAKISAHHPNVLLVENSVSRFAQDYLLAKNISLVLNVKRRRLERISHCTGSPIVPSIDILTSQKLGTCDLFHVEKFYEGQSSSEKIQKSSVKNLMFFEGCPKPLGCTVLLMGANIAELKKVKRVLQYGVFAAYHLALETSFFADEGATLPELSLKSPINATLPEKPSDFGHSISTISGFTISSADNTYVRNIVQIGSKIHSEDPNSMSCSNFNTETILPHISYQTHNSQEMENFHYPVSSFNHLSAAENNRSKHFAQIQSSIHFTSPHFVLGSDGSDSYFNHHTKENYNIMENTQKSIGRISEHEKGHNFIIPVGYNNPFQTVDGASLNNVIPRISERRMVGDLIYPYFRVFEDNSHMKVQETPFIEDFPPSPSDHQSFLVSLSIRCVWKRIVCEQAHLLRIKYYGSFDKPLGRFLWDDLFDKYYQCRSCEMPSEAHVHCYNHKQGNLTISVRKISEVLPGEHDGKIWMWHSCLRCPREEDGNPPRTLRVVMSDAAWGLSFGKFLELSFCNHTAASRVASCGHSLQRDCLRFYGFGQMVACFRYASIDIHSVYLPPSQLDFSTTIQDWIKNGLNEVTIKAEILFTEVLNAISQISEKQMNTQSISEARHRVRVLEKMLHEEKAEFEEYLYNVIKRESKDNLSIDVLDVNNLHRRLFFHSYLWDQRLRFAAKLTENSPENICSIEKLIDHLSSKSTGSSTSNSPSLETIDNDQPVLGVCQVDQVGELCIPQSLEILGDPKIEPCQYSKCRNEIQGFCSNPLIHQFDQSSCIIHGSSSEKDTLNAKRKGDNANILTVSEDLKENCELYRNRYLSIPKIKKDGDIAVFFFRWSDLSFQTMYQFIFERIFSNTSLLKIVIDHTPVYVSQFCKLTDYHGTRSMLYHGIDDIDIPIYDDEPSSIISYALITSEYNKKLNLERERLKEGVNSPIFKPSEDSIDDTTLPMSGNRSSMEPDQHFIAKVENIKVSFTDEGPFGKVNYSVTCYRAVHFDVLRKICCPSKLDYVRSLRRCKKWGAQGGKSNVFFAKSLDDRFIIKQVTKTELDSFLDFGTKYFKYLRESISSRSPTCLAKVLGIYQVTTKYLRSGKETKIDLLIMENIFCGKNITRLYDLKGSLRSRYNADSSGNNKVLLDQNLIEAIPTSPIFIGNKAKRLLERSVWNDTAFLASVHVMDYSLLVGVDEQKHELVLGIIDFVRQYTWDKHLESWVKTTGILGGSNALPTVVSPQQYKKRFRKAMSSYFLMVPDQWSPPTIIPSMSQSDFAEDNTQMITLKS